jgi:hypothetical protein
MKVKMKEEGVRRRRAVSEMVAEPQPLLVALIGSAQRKGQSSTELARELGVSYQRFGQWRRKPEELATAGDEVYVRAAHYLGLPLVLVRVMGGNIALSDFLWPTSESLDVRLQREIEDIRSDPFLGGFVPSEIDAVPNSVKLFTVFLYSHLKTQGTQGGMSLQWVRAMHNAIDGKEVQAESLF